MVERRHPPEAIAGIVPARAPARPSAVTFGAWVAPSRWMFGVDERRRLRGRSWKRPRKIHRVDIAGLAQPSTATLPARIDPDGHLPQIPAAACKHQVQVRSATVRG